MSRIALIFSGYPRYIEQSSGIIHNNIINNNDVDVYSFTWNVGEFHKVKEYYNPICESGSKPIQFNVIGDRSNICNNWSSLQFAARSFYNYIRTSNLKYDYIVRTRHDAVTHNIIDFSSLDKDKIYVCNNHWRDSEHFDDNLMIMNTLNYVSVYHDLYDWFLSLDNDKRSQYVSPESMLYCRMEELDLIRNVIKSDHLNLNLVRS